MIVLANAQYWLEYITQLAENAPLSEADLKCATRALDTAAATPGAWQVVLPLASALHPYMERRGHWEEWETFLQYLLYYARQQSDPQAEIQFLIRLGGIRRVQGNYQASITAYQKAWRACRADGTFVEAVVLSNISDLYRLLGYFWRAETLCCQALVLFRKFDDDMRLAYTENTMGLIYFDQRNWEQALVHYQRAESLFRQIKHTPGLAMVYQNLGALYNYLDDLEKALRCSTCAYDYYKSANNKLGLARTQLNMGYTWLKSENLSRAKQASVEAEKVFDDMGDSLNLARVRHNLGMIYTLDKRWKDAEHCFERALEQWEACQDWWNYANTLGELANMYMMRGQWSEAQHYLEAEAKLVYAHNDPRYIALKHELETRYKKYPPKTC